jgi:hypothetical protein
LSFRIKAPGGARCEHDGIFSRVIFYLTFPFFYVYITKTYDESTGVMTPLLPDDGQRGLFVSPYASFEMEISGGHDDAGQAIEQ